MSFISLPVVDLHDDETTIIDAILNAGLTTGFFYLRNHGLTEAQDCMFTLCKEYFRLPIDVKEQHAINHENFGYMRRGQENLDSTKSKKQIDEKEGFNFKKVIHPHELPLLFAQSDNFQLITSFHRACYNLSMKLLTYLAQSFQVDGDYFTSRHRWDTETGEILRLLHYPATQASCTPDDTKMRAGAHSDYGSITLLFQHEQKTGLEVLDRSNNVWYPVEARDDMIVVNFGDASEYWSKGLIKSIVHRVTIPVTDVNVDNERFSIVYFAHPTLSAPLTPIPSKLVSDRKFIKDVHAQHALNHENEDVLTAGEHLQWRLKQTHTYA